MAIKKYDNIIFQLRRDNDYNYEKIKDTFIPAIGEPCLVDTAKNGLRVKIGDGLTPFGELPFIDEDFAINVVVKGYLSNNQFYYDAELINPIEASINKIYIDVVKNTLYQYNGLQYIPITQTITAATSSEAGVVKLYDIYGLNTDGTMTQRAITEELKKKIEISLNPDDESLSFIRELYE